MVAPRKVDLEALTRALLTRRRQDVAKEFNVPYNALCGYAQLVGIPVQASTIYGGFVRAVEFLFWFCIRPDSHFAAPVGRYHIVGASQRLAASVESLDADEEIAKSVLFTYAHVQGGAIQKTVCQLIAAQRPELLTKIARRGPKPDWLIERRNARRRKAVEFFTVENLTNITEVAKKIGVSRESIYQYLDEAGVKRRAKVLKRSENGKKRARTHG